MAFLLLVTALLLTATACGSGTIRGIAKIGLVAPFGGSDAVTGLQMLYAARLALREWNARGGVDGFRVALQAEDDRNAAAGGEQQARAMVVDPAVIGVLGHITSASAEAGAPHYGAAGLSLVTFGNVVDWPQVSGSTTVFRLTAPPQKLARAIGELAAGKLKAKIVVLVHEPGTFDELFVQSVSQELRSAGATSIRRVVVAVTQSRYDEAAQGIAEAQPGAVILATNFVTAGEIAAELRPLSSAPIVLAPQAERPAILRIGGGALQGAYSLATARYPTAEGGAQSFVDAYRQLAGAAPTDNAALAYDATNVLLTAAQSQVRRDGRIDRAGVLRELANGDALEGVTGRISFDEQRSRLDAPAFIYRVTGSSYPGELVEAVPGR